MRISLYFLLGLLFGVVLLQSQVVSWYRIYEMFRFESFHMYGVIGSAVLVGAFGLQIMKRSQLRDADGEKIDLPDKNPSIPRYLIGGIIFGLGWGLVGACPGPIFALIGAGYSSLLLVLLGALGGTLIYGITRKRLPH